MSDAPTEAFGAPGIAPTWSSSDKDFVTAALNSSRVWATIGHGIINEVYWPSTGQPQVRDLGFYLVGKGRWIDLKRERRYRLLTPGPGLPALEIVHHGEDYQLTLEILPDPLRDVLLVRFALTGEYRLVFILAPHVGSSGRDNSAWLNDGSAYAHGSGFSLCLAASVPLEHLSCGFVGASDGWQDLNRHGSLTYEFQSAKNGTVAITGEASRHHGVLALGFADSPAGAHTRARTALAADFDVLRSFFIEAWAAWGSSLSLPRPDETLGDAAELSAAVLKIHEDRAYPGAVVASLSVPWGNSTESLGGYHLVWPRDASLTGFALVAANHRLDARQILSHLIAAQRRDGHWPQNYFPSGQPYWDGIQLDEAALPVLLAAKLAELGDIELRGTREMIRAAVGFLARSGPASSQDRWEENPGIGPFTLATAIAALVAAGPWLEPEERSYALELADDWNERLESWCYVENTELAAKLGVHGYYVRIAPPRQVGADDGRVELRNRDGETINTSALVSLDFSYLVRLGLRSGLDPRIQDTIRVVDQLLAVETPSGTLYRRYNGDGYGEHADGSSFDGRGIGRPWPLLVGERGHLALQSGEDPLPYLQTMWRCASAGGLLPEQVWDADPIPELDLAPGRPSGGAMPLVWAHAEFLKLLVARERGRPVEWLASVEQHFGQRPAPHPGEARNGGAQAASGKSGIWHWREEVPIVRLPAGKLLIVEDRVPFTLHLGFDGWQRVADRPAQRGPFGIWSVALTEADLAAAHELNFTRWYESGWENCDYRVSLERSASDLSEPSAATARDAAVAEAA
ncbi:MAG TPA: glycoside hydrolase family 15 protein [Steroidobacteraceae bacterium]|jgi:glucoamylase|nr:glycoside hydrolase family 15 protein [Steroidobacteraceae bacterium]